MKFDVEKPRKNEWKANLNPTNVDKIVTILYKSIDVTNTV